MTMTGLGRGLVVTGLLALLLVAGGCMMFPPHGGSMMNGKGYNSTISHDGAPPETGSGTIQAEPESTPMHVPGGGHGMGKPASPWPWLAGGGMVLMMLLMAL